MEFGVSFTLLLQHSWADASYFPAATKFCSKHEYVCVFGVCVCKKQMQFNANSPVSGARLQWMSLAASEVQQLSFHSHSLNCTLREQRLAGQKTSHETRSCQAPLECKSGFNRYSLIAISAHQAKNQSSLIIIKRPQQQQQQQQ